MPTKYQTLFQKGGTQLNSVKNNNLFECNNQHIKPLFDETVYPWEIISKIGEYVSKLVKNGIEGFTLYKEGILIGENVKIYPNVIIEAPAVIGKGTEIRPGAFIRGNVITGDNCVIGNSSELKNCVLLDKVQIPHYNYVGDSILGNYAHMGAGSICSNLKNDGKNVVIHAKEDIETGLRKIGGILGDYANIGCSCVINPGTVIGKYTTVYPLTSVRGVIPKDCIVKNANTIIKRK